MLTLQVQIDCSLGIMMTCAGSMKLSTNDSPALGSCCVNILLQCARGSMPAQSLLRFVSCVESQRNIIRFIGSNYNTVILAGSYYYQASLSPTTKVDNVYLYFESTIICILSSCLTHV